jgi:hypothetical protein
VKRIRHLTNGLATSTTLSSHRTESISGNSGVRDNGSTGLYDRARVSLAPEVPLMPSAAQGASMTDLVEQSPEPTDDKDERDDSHLDDIEEGAGCTEIWEHLAEKRGQ